MPSDCCLLQAIQSYFQIFKVVFFCSSCHKCHFGAIFKDSSRQVFDKLPAPSLPELFSFLRACLRKFYFQELCDTGNFKCIS